MDRSSEMRRRMDRGAGKLLAGHRKCEEEWTEMQESRGQVTGNAEKNGLKCRKAADRSTEMRRRIDRGAGKLLAGHRKCEEEWTEMQESCWQVNRNAEKNGPRCRKVADRSSEMRRRVDRGAGKL